MIFSIICTLYVHWELATNIEYRTLSSLFGLGRSNVGEIEVETCKALFLNRQLNKRTQNI